MLLVEGAECGGASACCRLSMVAINGQTVFQAAQVISLPSFWKLTDEIRLLPARHGAGKLSAADAVPVVKDSTADAVLAFSSSLQAWVSIATRQYSYSASQHQGPLPCPHESGSLAAELW